MIELRPSEPVEFEQTVPLLTFCGFDLELYVQEVLDRRDWPSLCWARDPTGRRWLIMQTDDDPLHLEWMCAPASERAIRAVRDGYCAPVDVFCHSATGTIELVTVDHGRAIPDRCLVCGCVLDHLSSSGKRLAAAAA
jgi:hypothetical protein